MIQTTIYLQSAHCLTLLFHWWFVLNYPLLQGSNEICQPCPPVVEKTKNKVNVKILKGQADEETGN